MRNRVCVRERSGDREFEVEWECGREKRRVRVCWGGRE